MKKSNKKKMAGSKVKSLRKSKGNSKAWTLKDFSLFCDSIYKLSKAFVNFVKAVLYGLSPILYYLLDKTGKIGAKLNSFFYKRSKFLV